MSDRKTDRCKAVKQFNLQECRDFIEKSSPRTEIIVGSDSERHKIHGVWHFTVTTAVIVHIDGNKGCRVFGDAETHRDYDARKDKPAMRLMAEVEAASKMYLLLEDVIAERSVEIHLDVNTSELHGSSCVLHQAIGYIRGTCGITPKVKPEAFGASHTADRLVSILSTKASSEELTPRAGVV